MKKKTRCFVAIVLLLILVLSACAKPADVDEPSSTPKSSVTPAVTAASRPKITPGPKVTPKPTPGVRYGFEYEYLQCEIDTTARDEKTTWKIYKPIGTPDPNWTIESVDGDIVTYSSIKCDHETPDPYAFHPEETEGTAEIEGAEEITEVTPTPEV